ncbi:hypothetical protein B0H19DRAFT_604688 [Mycena capillaripes]|nr:hypothetical protein B0H19DRAFT_604688 [Mycena capillaripes]
MYGYVLGPIKPSISSIHTLILLVISAGISKLAAKAVSSLAVYLTALWSSDSVTRYRNSQCLIHCSDLSNHHLTCECNFELFVRH